MNDTDPSRQLAALLVERMVDAKLLRSEKREVLIDRIAAGEMSGEDWKIEIEVAAGKTTES
jgi:hypothetical protein